MPLSKSEALRRCRTRTKALSSLACCCQSAGKRGTTCCSHCSLAKLSACKRLGLVVSCALSGMRFSFGIHKDRGLFPDDTTNRSASGFSCPFVLFSLLKFAPMELASALGLGGAPRNNLTRTPLRRPERQGILTPIPYIGNNRSTPHSQEVCVR